MTFIAAYDFDGVILHHAIFSRQTINRAPTVRPCSPTFVQHSGEKKTTLGGTEPSTFFMTVQEVAPLLLSRISCVAGNGRFWKITILTRWVHAITISLPK